MTQEEWERSYDGFETRDLQCLVRFEEPNVELKVCHVQFDEADAIEHRVYEIVRTLHEENLNQSEEFVNTELLYRFR